MAQFQRGDVVIQIDGHPYTLRFTLGALAELSTRWSAPGPLSLAKMFRHLTPDAARTLLACLLRPALSGDADRLAAELCAEDLRAGLHAASELIVETLNG